MPNQSTKVISIRRDILASDDAREVADHAFSLWLEKGFWGGSPEEALFTAVRQMRPTTTTRLFLVPKRDAVYTRSLVVLN